MIVVADSSPLHYLILLEQVDLLRHLYSEVLIPQAVVTELTSPAAPSEVRTWVSNPPAWLTVMPVTAEEMAKISESLDDGERAAIALAETVRADLVLIDEAAGRAEARRRKLRVTGTVGVLRVAAEMGLVDVPDVLRRLEATNFYVDEDLLRSVFAPWL
jgi:predicted nucleic acid-binding protein